MAALKLDDTTTPDAQLFLKYAARPLAELRELIGAVQIVAEASAQCADLDEKPEEYECRRSWRAAIEKRLPLPSNQLSLMSALAPVPFVWLAIYFGLAVNRWRHRRRH